MTLRSAGGAAESATLLILEIYGELAEAIATVRPYQTRLDLPPSDPRVAHPPRGAS